jgi:hypothetical protein
LVCHITRIGAAALQCIFSFLCFLGGFSYLCKANRASGLGVLFGGGAEMNTLLVSARLDAGQKYEAFLADIESEAQKSFGDLTLLLLRAG